MTIKETELSAREYEAEQGVKEESSRNRARYLGEEDARQGIDSDATRHDISPEDHIEYDIGYESEVKFRQHIERLDANKAQREAQQKAVLKNMVLHTEDICQKIVPAASQRFRVIHANTMGVWLNKDAHGFATFEAAKLHAMDLVEEAASLPGDVITIEEKGEILFLHEVSS